MRVCFRVLLWGWLWLLPAALAFAQLPSLSDQERNWIAQQGAVPVVVVDGNAPYYSRHADGTPVGFAIDMMDRIGERTGLRWAYRWVPSAQAAAQLLATGEVQMTPLAAPSPVREPFATFPGALLDAELVLVTRSDVTDVSEAQNFAGRRVAIVQAQVPGEMLTREFPGTRVLSFETTQQALQAVATGQADLCVAWLHEALYHIEANLLANLRVRREDRAGRSFLGPAVSRQQPLLDSIVRKALESISPAERAAAARRWLPVGSSALWVPGKVELSDAERNWVQRAGDVRIGFDREFAPFTSSSGLGRFEGLGADMFRLAAQKVGLRVIEQSGASFADTYERAARGELDVVVGMARTESRRALFDFVGPFSSSPTVLVMRSSDPRQWRTPDDIESGSLGLLREHFLLPQLRSRRPGLALAEFSSQAEMLEALDTGEVAAAIGNATVINRLIDARYTGRLRLTGVLPDADSELFFGVRKSRPELARLLEKGFEAITPGEAADIKRRWLLVSVQPGLTWVDVTSWAVPIALGGLLVICMMWLANRRLKLAHLAEREARADAERAIEAHRRAEALLNDVAAHVPGIVFRYVVRPDGSFAHRYTSPGTMRFMGVDQLDPTRSILREVIDRVREDHRAGALAAERASMRTGQPFKLTVAYLNPERGSRWVHAEAVQRTEPDGTRVWTGYVVDVSAERELQARLAREAESRNLLMASASHELRAPTHLLSLALQSVSDRGLDAQQADALEIARQSAQTLTQLLNDVLDAARFSTDAIKLRPRSFDLQALLTEVAGAWRAAAGSKGLVFELHASPDLPRRVVLDPLRLKQLLTNLLSNACKYTAAGRVWLEASRAADGGLRFVVGDTGAGIDAKLRATLFEPYATAEREAGPTTPEGSTGLGLAICRQLCTLMGGRIELHSEAGRGTEVTLDIPWQDELAPASAGPRSGAVLVCDDDPVSRLMMTEMLCRLGFEAEGAADARDALARWRRGGVGAIVTDLDMPGLGGLELIREVRQAEQGREHPTVMVVCSGSELPELKSSGRTVHHDAYLLKPVQMDLLAQTLHDLGLMGA